MVESDYGKQEHHNGVYAAEWWLAGVHHLVIYSLVQLLWETRMVDECPPSRNFHKTTHREDRRIAPDVNLMDHVLNDVETVLNSQTFSMQECRWYWDVRHNHLVRGMNRRVRKHSWYTRYWTTVHDKTSKHVHSKSKQWGACLFIYQSWIESGFTVWKYPFHSVLFILYIITNLVDLFMPSDWSFCCLRSTYLTYKEK